MICDRYEVKRARGEFDGLSLVSPDVDFDVSHGYSVSFRLLVADGVMWVCSDNTAGAAVWGEDDSDDILIHQHCREVTENLCRYLDNRYLDSDSKIGIAELVFTSPATITWTDASVAGFTDYFFVGDTMWIGGSRKNDGPYDLLTVAAGVLGLDDLLPQAMTDDSMVTLVSSSFPAGLKAVAGKMVSFDIWERPNRTPGVTSESIGSYSYSLEGESINGLGYPDDMVAALQQYKRPRIR